MSVCVTDCVTVCVTEPFTQAECFLALHFRRRLINTCFKTTSTLSFPALNLSVCAFHYRSSVSVQFRKSHAVTMSYSIHERVIQSKPADWFSIVETTVSHAANGGTSTEVDGEQRLTMGGKGTSGMHAALQEPAWRLLPGGAWHPQVQAVVRHCGRHEAVQH